MKITLLDAHDERYEGYWRLIEAERQDYCARHGYELACYRFDRLDPPERQPNWGRVPAILHHLPNCDWLMYLDTDCVIMNPDVGVESFIDEQYNLVVGPLPTEGHMMTSAMVFKNCEWSFEFLRTLYDQTYFINHVYDPKDHEPYEQDHHATAGHIGCYFEQSALEYLYDKVDKYYEKIKVVPRSLFNANVYNYRPGDFLIHVSGRIYDRMKIMRLCVEGQVEEARRQAARVDHPQYHPTKPIRRRRCTT